MPTDIIRLRNMLFHAHHGVWDEEREVGQRFEVDVDIFADTTISGKSDLLRDTIDLYRVYETVERVVTQNRFKLVEALAENIAKVIIGEFRVQKLRVKVRKPNSPIRGIADGIEVEIERGAV